MFWRVHLFIFIGLLLVSQCAYSQTLTAKTLNIDDGLSQSAVNDVIKGPQGFYWFATQDGLSRYDGYTFKVYNSKSSPDLKSNYITRIAIFDDSQILLGTSNGLYRLNVLTDELTSVLPQQLTPLSIHDVLVGPDKNVVVLANDRLFLLNAALNIHSDYAKVNAAQVKQGRSLFTYQQQLFYVSENNHLKPLFSEQKQPLEISYFNAKVGPVVHKAQEFNNALWVATNDGVWRLSDMYSLKVIDKVDAQLFWLDSKNKVWLSGRDGLFTAKVEQQSKIKPQQINTASNQTGILHAQSLLSIYADEDGLVWFGTLNKGIAFHSSDREWFENHSRASNEIETPSDDILTIEAIPYDVWVGSAAGLANYKGKKRILYNTSNQPSFYSNRVTKVTRDQYRRIWAGFDNGGLVYKDTGHSLFKRLDIGSVQVTDFLLVERLLYVTTRNDGLFVVNIIDKSVQHITKLKNIGLTTNRLQSIYRSEQGDIWLGSFDSGVFKFDADRMNFISLDSIYQTTPLALKTAIILDLYQSKNTLWVATTNGLYKINQTLGEFELINTDSGLPNDLIYTILPDNSGNLWLPTNRGIVVYNPDSKFMASYSKKDGFINQEYNANAFDVAKDGRIWAGGISGLTIISPLQRPKLEKVLQPKLTDIRLFNHAVDMQTKQDVWNASFNEPVVTLDAKVSMFSFYFSAFRPEISNAIKYKYQLKGFDEQWIIGEAGQNFATYTNIDYGDYQFLLSASLDGQTWSEPYPVGVIITPPTWLTIQAKILYIFVVLLLAYVFSYLFLAKRKVEKDSHKETKQNEQKLQLSMHTSGSILWELDLEKKEITLTDYQSVTPELKNMPITKSNLAEILHPDDSEILLSTLGGMSFQSSFMKEQYFRFKDVEGNYIWMRGRSVVSKRDKKGQALQIMGVSHNVNELKSTQVALRKLNQELEDRVGDRTQQLNLSNRDLKITLDNLQFAQEELLESQKMASLGSMVAGISHEINTPLGICVTAVSHLSNELEGLNKKFEEKTLTANDFSHYMENCSRSFELLDKNVYRAAELIKSFKQVSVDQSSEEQREFNLRKLLVDTVNTLTPEFKNNNISLDIECDEQINMNSFPGAISQIIINLIMNSLTHGFADVESGNVKVTVSNILQEYDELLIVYSDNGKGIEEKNLSKIFDPFYTSNRGGGNTGLGMHITYNLIVQKLKGAIAINSLPSIGAEFYIRLPIKVKDAN